MYIRTLKSITFVLLLFTRFKKYWLRIAKRTTSSQNYYDILHYKYVKVSPITLNMPLDNISS